MSNLQFWWLKIRDEIKFKVSAKLVSSNVPGENSFLISFSF